VTAIEVKSTRAPVAHSGTAAFTAAFRPKRSLLIGRDGIAVEEVLGKPVAHWIDG
jgi:hypothetical protein